MHTRVTTIVSSIQLYISISRLSRTPPRRWLQQKSLLVFFSLHSFNGIPNPLILCIFLTYSRTVLPFSWRSSPCTHLIYCTHLYSLSSHFTFCHSFSVTSHSPLGVVLDPVYHSIYISLSLLDISVLHT